MPQSLARQMTVSEFLEWAEEQPKGRYELVRGNIVAMAPERARHNLVKGRIFSRLETAAREAGLPCTVFTDGMTVVIDEHTSYEPDAVIECSETVDLETTVVANPLVVVEVLSPSTQQLDASGKLVDYFRVESVRHYLVVDAVRRAVTHHERNKKGAIDTRVLKDGDLRLDPPGLIVSVGDLLIEE